MTTEAPKRTSKATQSADMLTLMRKRFSAGVAADLHNREAAKKDLEFAYIPGEQWPKERREAYKNDGRPCLEINRMPTFLGQVIGDQRQAKPSIKVHPVDSKGDPETATIREGLIRSIEATSNADIAYDTAFEFTTGGGFGSWRIVTDYCDDASFDQEVKIKAITNNFSVVWDPISTEWDKSDAQWVIVHSVISRAEYEAKYPGKLPANISLEDDATYLEWVLEDAVRVAEYFFKKPLTKKIYLLESGEVVEELQEGKTSIKERTVDTYEIVRLKVDGYNILEDEKVWPSKYWPIVPVDGKAIYIDGKKYVWGVIRYAKDSQRAYNVTRSRETEMYMLAPISPLVATAKQIQGYEGLWNKAHKATLPYLLYNPDPENPGPPNRMAAPQISTALAQSAARDVDDMKACVGLFDASLGQRSNETSGIAIQARQKEGDTGTFPFIDNLGRAKLLTYKIILDLIPKIYDNQRIVQILGIDGTVTPTNINAPGQGEDGVETILNDMTAGKYDLTMTMGPSYSTQRMESADSLTRFVGAVPETGALIADLIAKYQDWPGSQEVARRLKTIVPPQALTPEEREEMAKDAPQPEGQAPPPDPKLIEMQMKMEIEANKLRMEMDLHELNKEKMIAEIENIRATGMKNIAQAEAAEVGTQMEAYKLELQQLSQNISHQVSLTLEEMRQNRQGMAPGGNGQGKMWKAGATPQAPPGALTTASEVQVNPEQMMQGTPTAPEAGMIPGRAEGGPVEAGKPYVVGEDGAEVVVPNYNAVHNPQLYFETRYNEARELGISPPRSPSLEDMTEYEQRANKLKESKITGVWPAAQVPIPMANGGDITPGQPYLVGEQGPEVIVPKQAGVVIPDPMAVLGLKKKAPVNDKDRISTILQRNASKNFVQRLMKPDLNPMLDMSYEKEGKSYTGAGTHLMSSAQVDGKNIVYPEIVQMPDGSLKRLNGDEAQRHALASGEFIEFDTPEEAEWFGKNYKSVWGQNELRNTHE